MSSVLEVLVWLLVTNTENINPIKLSFPPIYESYYVLISTWEGNTVIFGCEWYHPTTPVFISYSLVIYSASKDAS